MRLFRLNTPYKAFIKASSFAITLALTLTTTAYAEPQRANFFNKTANIQLGPRPSYLIEGLPQGKLKTTLQQCENRRFVKTDFSIGHRGAPLQFPEHTRESYEAAAKMGAGILECDVTFTADGELVCRHDQCDLHTTTNIITTDLNQQCTVPWNEDNPNPSSVKCCASDITLAQFKTLKGKMDSFNPQATTAVDYLGGVPSWRTENYDSRGTLMTHKESIELFKSLGRKFTPELKGPDGTANLQIEDIFGSQENYAQKMLDEYREAGVSPKNVYPQSFNLNDILYWIENEPEFAQQAVFLDGRYATGINPNDASTFNPTMDELVKQGVKIIAPPIFMLLAVENNGEIVPSVYAREAKKAGLDIITWSLERSDIRQGSRRSTDAQGNILADFYYQFDINPEIQTVNSDGDLYRVVDVLAQDVGVIGIFSDWPATVTYYANCMKL
ncbi:glycerophosphodiester phosphodiesterase family protein [Sessilibacter sp. MAH1]